MVDDGSTPRAAGPDDVAADHVTADHLTTDDVTADDIRAQDIRAQDIPAQDIAELVARLRRAMRRAARVVLPSMPLSVAQLELLSVVAEHPGTRPGDVADLLRLAPNSVSTLANAMVGAGMLAREPGERDRRTVEYTLTPRGSAMVAAWQDTNSNVLAAAVAGLSPARRAILAAALPVLADLVERIDAQADAPPTLQSDTAGPEQR